MGALSGKVAIVAGSATGVGAATARRLAADGASVVLGDIDEATAAVVADDIVAGGGAAAAFGFDISKEQDVAGLVAFATSTFGGVDALHNCAADFSERMLFDDRDVVDTPFEIYERALAVNLKGYLLTCRAVVPQLLERGGGTIVNTSSLASEMAERGLRMSYGISKAGVNAMSRHIAVAFGKRNVRCNVVSLGMVLTDKLRAGLSPEMIAHYTERIPAPRATHPEDVAGVVSFLLSDASRGVNGQTLVIDGGQSVAT